MKLIVSGSPKPDCILNIIGGKAVRNKHYEPNLTYVPSDFNSVLSRQFQITYRL